MDTRKRDQLPHAIGIKFYIESQPVSSQPFDISVFIEIVAFGKAKVSNKGHHNPRCGTVAVLSELKEKTPSIAYEELMSITAGSFLELYGPNKPSDTLNDPAAIELKNSSKDSFDVVVTNFLDTASNIIEYVRAINHVLKNGGRWINFGPLLWHFEGDYNVSYINREDNVSIPDIKKG